MAEPTLGTVLEAIGTAKVELTVRIDRLDRRMGRFEQEQTKLRVELSERIDRLQD